MSVTLPAASAVERIAGLVAEGREVEWELELATHPQARRQIENLRALAALVPGASPSRPTGDPMPSSWGHLHLLAELGAGGFGTVYRAFDPVLQREVALKLRRLDAADPRAGAFSFIEEARRLARVRHPHVLAVHGADIHDDLPGLWSDLIEGGTLEEELESKQDRSRAEATERAVEVGGALASALAAIHEAGLAHGDVKASNVAVEPSGRVVLLDFGASSAYETSGTGSAFGSPLSAAPERLRGGGLQPSADLYGLGVVLYRLLARGAYPIPASTSDELLEAHERNAAQLAAGTLTGSPRVLRRLVVSLLAADPAARPSASETVVALAEVAASPARRRRRIALATAFVGLAAAAIALAIGLGAARAQRQLAEAARDRAQQEAERAQQVQALLVDLFRASDPSQSRGEDTTARELLERAVERIDDGLVEQPAIQAELLGVVGQVYRTLGRYDHSAELLSRAVAMVRSSDEPDVLLLARLLKLFGEALTGAGRYDDGEAALREALELRRTYAGPTSIEVAESSDALAVNRHFVSKFDEAEALLEEALAIFTTKLGADSPAAIGTLGNLAILALEQGELEEGVSRSQRVLELQLAAHGEDHPQVAIALTTLASAQRRAGQLAEARASLERSLVIKRRVFEPGHPSIITSLNNLAATLSNLGEYAEAATMFREALELDVAALGDEHPSTARVRENLAGMLVHMGATQEAATLLDRAAPITRSAGGGDPVSWAAHLSVRSWLEERRGNLPAAIAAAEEGLVSLESSLGPQHGRTTILRSRRARLEADPRIREHHLRQALDDQLAALPAGHLEIALTRLELGATLLELDHAKGASVELDQAAGILEQVVPAGHWRLDEVAALAAVARCDRAQTSVHLARLEIRPGLGHPATERVRRQISRCGS